MTFPILLIRMTNTNEAAKKLQKMFMAMPIERKTIVQARFTYELIYNTLLFSIIGIVSLMQAEEKSIVVIVTAATSFIIFFCMFCGISLAAEFAAKKTSSIDFVIGILPAVGLIIVHLLLVALTPDNRAIFMSIPIPIIALLLLNYYYKRSVKQLEMKEFA